MSLSWHDAVAAAPAVAPWYIALSGILSATALAVLTATELLLAFCAGMAASSITLIPGGLAGCQDGFA